MTCTRTKIQQCITKNPKALNNKLKQSGVHFFAIFHSLFEEYDPDLTRQIDHGVL